MREVEKCETHPSKNFYHLDEWEQRLDDIISRYNATRQDGKRIKGLSPEAAFKAFENADDAPMKFSAACQAFLSHHRKPIQIQPTGKIIFDMRGERFVYFNEETGRRKGQRLIAWIDLERPDLIAVSDENLRDAFTVERHHSPNALRTDQVYADEVAKANAAASYSKARYRVLKLKYGQTFRPNLPDDPRAVQFCQHIEEQHKASIERREEKTRLKARVLRKARERGMPSGLLSGLNDAQLAALEALDKGEPQAARGTR